MLLVKSCHGEHVIRIMGGERAPHLRFPRQRHTSGSMQKSRSMCGFKYPCRRGMHYNRCPRRLWVVGYTCLSGHVFLDARRGSFATVSAAAMVHVYDKYQPGYSGLDKNDES
ncbi:hypothetical protein BV22DRAFT_113163 [Leucogyrophana mollusca]|uniref:Uncharacterized protein n=1 Tax=Leucogyrophana mollusca TaxID=85980 RepID=A0ACB8BWK6_9AGAM|nr:hypothetical protein BV22DRAFT_113163 [Leucogyrophana mollusca]